MIDMMSETNKIRDAAKKEYEKIPLNEKGNLLFAHYSNTENVFESMALVLLRRLIAAFYEDFFKDQQVQKDQFHAEILRWMSTETQQILRKHPTDLLAEFVRKTTDEDSGKQAWTGIIQFLEMCASSEQSEHRETAVSLIESVPNIFGSKSLKYISGIKQMFHSTLFYGTNSSVRTAAVRANVPLFVTMRKMIESTAIFPTWCQQSSKFVSMWWKKRNEDVPLQCLGIPHFADIFALCAAKIANPEKDESYRHNSLAVDECFKFNISLIEQVWVELDRILQNGDYANQTFPIEQISFIVSSVPDRLYNSQQEQAASISSVVATFEQNLLRSLLQALETNEFHGELISFILHDYNVVSSEFINRFLWAILRNSQLEERLHTILKLNIPIKRRKREEFMLTLIKFAEDSKTLQIFFGDSILSDQVLRKCLTVKALSLNSSSSSAIRHSQKVAQYFALISQHEVVSALIDLVKLFADQCRFLELVTLQSQFQLSIAIVDFAKAVSPKMRKEIREEIIHLLVPVFPQIIQQPDISRRQIGMFLAETLFTLFECPSPPKFDYQKEDPVLQEFISIIQDEVEANEKQNEEKKVEQQETFKQRGGKKIDPRVTILDSDDEEDAQNHEQMDGEDSDDQQAETSGQQKFAYLRDCLELLRTKEDDWRRWEAALDAIPGMVKRRAVGFDEIAMELLETMLFLQDRFNTPKFTAIKTNIMKLVLAQKPELVAHFLRLFGSRNCSMTHRHLLLIVVVQAAKQLAGVEDDDEKPKIELIGDENNEKRIPSIATKKSPKIIWRSNALESVDNGTTNANKFSPIASQFAFSLLDLCTCTKFEQRDFLLLGKAIWALGEVISCSRNSHQLFAFRVLHSHSFN